MPHRTAFASIALLALLSCQSGGGSSPSGDDNTSRVAMGTLPATEREVIAAFRSGGAEWEEMRERVRADPKIASFVVDNMLDQMLRSFSGSVSDNMLIQMAPADRAAQIAEAVQRKGPFARSQDELVALGEHSAPILVALLDAELSDGVTASLALDTLERIGSGPWTAEIADHLRSSNSNTRRRAIEAMSRTKPSATTPLDAGTWVGRRPVDIVAHYVKKDDDWIVRGSAAEALGTLGRGSEEDVLRAVRATLETALRDEDPLVWGAAARGFSRLGDPRAIPVLADALGRASDAGRLGEVRTIQAAMVVLSGKQGPSNPSPRAWHLWYDERRSAFERR